MAHFAQIDENNKVFRVLVVDNSTITDENGVEQESMGIKYLRNLFGQNTNWVQTSYHSNFRNKYAGPGYTFDKTRDAFISPRPYDNWTLDETTLEWIPPVPYPNDGNFYVWDEVTDAWALI